MTELLCFDLPSQQQGFDRKPEFIIWTIKNLYSWFVVRVVMAERSSRQTTSKTKKSHASHVTWRCRIEVGCRRFVLTTISMHRSSDTKIAKRTRTRWVSLNSKLLENASQIRHATASIFCFFFSQYAFSDCSNAIRSSQFSSCAGASFAPASFTLASAAFSSAVRF